MRGSTWQLAEFALAEVHLPDGVAAGISKLLDQAADELGPPHVQWEPLPLDGTGIWQRDLSADTQVEAMLIVSGTAQAAQALVDDRGLLTAAAIGVEAGLRLRTVLAEQLAKEGWDPAGVSITCGVALAVSRLLEATVDQAARALSIASTQAAGLLHEGGTRVAGFQRTRAVANGIEAAELACAGLTAPVTGIEGSRGLAALQAPGVEVTPICAGLGQIWLLDELVAS
jgi:2-methylcitrate dehydratase MmgE/PrpD-like protein